MGDYKHPEVLVSTDWVAAHADDPKVRLVEVDVDTTAYEKGHIKNAIAWNWTSQLQDNVRRDLLGQKQFEELCRNSGISNDTTVVLYGDNNNWFAAYALWQAKYFGHKDARLMNGGRKKWELDLAGEVFWAQGRAADERRAQEVGARTQADRDRSAEVPCHEL